MRNNAALPKPHIGSVPQTIAGQSSSVIHVGKIFSFEINKYYELLNKTLGAAV